MSALAFLCLLPKKMLEGDDLHERTLRTLITLSKSPLPRA